MRKYEHVSLYLISAQKLKQDSFKLFLVLRSYLVFHTSPSWIMCSVSHSAPSVYRIKSAQHQTQLQTPFSTPPRIKGLWFLFGRAAVTPRDNSGGRHCSQLTCTRARHNCSSAALCHWDIQQHPPKIWATTCKSVWRVLNHVNIQKILNQLFQYSVSTLFWEKVECEKAVFPRLLLSLHI